MIPTQRKPRRPASGGVDAHVSADAIARRAHELFEARGSVHGHDLDDWLMAERELQPSPKKRNSRTVRAD